MSAPPGPALRWIRWIMAHARVVLLAATALTVVAGWGASRLVIDADLRSLLPTDHPVVRNLERLEATFSGTGSVNLVVKGADVETRHRFADAVAHRLEGHPMLRRIDYRLPSDFFAEHALYYLSDSDMDELEARVEAWRHQEVCARAPDVCTLEADPKAAEKLRAFVERKRADALGRTGFRDYYEREGIDALVMLLQPKRPSSELQFTREVVASMRSHVGDVHAKDPAWAAAGLTYNLVGPYITKADEQATIRRDMIRGGAFGLGGVVLVLLVLFRSSRGVIILLFPLLCGVTWSLGATWAVLGHLNSMTSLISTVVMGVGIDAGIHFYSRVRRERREHDVAGAIERTFAGLIVPLLVASSTTIGAFLVMATSEFPAFHEFGVIAAMGVALCLLAMVTVLPALTYAVGLRRTQPRRSSSSVAARVLARPGLVFGVVVLGTVLSFQGVRRVAFEYNGRTLQSDHARSMTEADTHLISRIFGRDIHAAVLVTSSAEEVAEVLGRARRRHAIRREEGTTVVADFFGISDLLPPQEVDATARHARIEALIHGGGGGGGDGEDDSGGWDDVPEVGANEAAGGPPGLLDDAPDEGEDWGEAPPKEPEGLRHRLQSIADGKSQSDIAPADARRLLSMLDAKPFGIDELPPRVLEKVRAGPNAFGVFAYPAFDAADIAKCVTFMEETAAYLPHDSRGMFVGETTVYAAMYDMMRSEAPIVLGMAGVLIAALVFWQLRSLGGTFMTLLPLGLGLWWLLALMGISGLKFTLFNLPIVPAVLGIGVDNGVYLADKLRRLRDEPEGPIRALSQTGSAILAATATTAIGFAAFLVADSGGLRTIGNVAVLGICLAALSAVLVLPTLAELSVRRRDRRGVAAAREL